MSGAGTTTVTARGGAREVKRKILTHLHFVNVGVNWTSNLAQILGSFIVTPAILFALGDQQYGIWLLIGSFIGQMRILDLGMTSGCMKYSAGYLEPHQPKLLLNVFNTSVALFLLASFLALIGTFLLTMILPVAYPALLGNMRAVILILGLTVVIDLLFRPYAASLRARSFFFVYDAIETCAYLVFKLGLVLYLAHIGMSLWKLCLINLTESLVRNLIVVGWSLRLCRWTTRPNPFAADRQMLWRLLTYSGAVFLISLADLFRFQINAAVIGYFLPGEGNQISIYGIGFRLVALASASVGVIGSILIPRFSGLNEKGDRGGMVALLKKANMATGLLAVFALVNIAVFGHQFLGLWIHKPWVDQSFVITSMALPAFGVSLLQGPASGMLSGMGRLPWQTAITLGEAALNVTISLSLVRHFGIYGVCLGTTLPMFLVRGFLFPLVFKHETGIGFFEYYRMHRLTFTMAILYGALLIPLTFLHYDNLSQLFSTCILSTLVYFGIALLLPQTRALLQQYGGKLLFRRARRS